MDKTVTLLLYRDVKNMDEIRTLLLSGELKASVLSPKYVYHPQQLLLAAHKSLFALEQNSLQTKTLYTEVLYSLYPGRKITDALRTLSVKEGDTSAAFVILGEEGGEAKEQIRKLVKGIPMKFDDLCDVFDIKAILHLYKVPPFIMMEDDILNVILTRMATKDFL